MKRLLLYALFGISALAVLSLLFVALVVWLLGVVARSEYFESYYPTRENAEATGGVGGWMPEWLVSESAANIHEMHNIDTNYVWVRFEFEASDGPDVPPEARRLETEELRSIQVPGAPYGGRSWWDLPDESLDPIAELPGVEAYEVRKKDSSPKGEERLGYLVVDRTERVVHYFFGYYSRDRARA